MGLKDEQWASVALRGTGKKVQKYLFWAIMEIHNYFFERLLLIQD